MPSKKSLGEFRPQHLDWTGRVKTGLSHIQEQPVRRISENFNIQFRSEFFNVRNRTNFAPPTDNLAVFDQTGNSGPSAGRITSTQTTSRQIQFALKLIW